MLSGTNPIVETRFSGKPKDVMLVANKILAEMGNSYCAKKDGDRVLISREGIEFSIGPVDVAVSRTLPENPAHNGAVRLVHREYFWSSERARMDFIGYVILAGAAALVGSLIAYNTVR